MIIGANGDSLFKRLMKVPHRESVFGDGKSPQEWSTAFFAPENMDGEWWRMKWCLEIYGNLPLLWFLFRDSLGWCYQCDRLRGLKISGQKISDKSLNKRLPGLLHFTDISDWSGGVIFDSHTGMVPGRSFGGPLRWYCYLRRWRAVMHNQIPHTWVWRVWMSRLAVVTSKCYVS